MPTAYAGERVTADLLNEFAPLSAVKSADESVTSSTTLQNDDSLFLSVAANTSYQISVLLVYNGGTQGSSDLKVGWTAPSGATLVWGIAYRDTGGAAHIGAGDITLTLAAGTNGTSNNYSVLVTATLTTGSTAGTLQLQWAQNTSSSTATTVKAGSSLIGTQLS